MVMLPAKETEAEAKAEVERLEKLRAENNRRCELHWAKPKEEHNRGDCFLFIEDKEPWSYKAID